MARRSRGQRRRCAARQRKEIESRRAAAFDQASSRLMSLPAELRNRIWLAVFEGSTQNLRNTTADGTVLITIHSTAPPLLCTCKQVYDEALGIYYSSTTFVNSLFRFLSSSASMTRRWMESIGTERAKTIKTIHLQLRMYQSRAIDLDKNSNEEHTHVMFECLYPLRHATDILTIEGNDAPTVKANVCYYWAEGQCTVWTSKVEETHREVIRAYSKGTKALGQWLVEQGPSVSSRIDWETD